MLLDEFGKESSERVVSTYSHALLHKRRTGRFLRCAKSADHGRYGPECRWTGSAAFLPDARTLSISTNTENAIAKYTYPFGMWRSKDSAIRVTPTRRRKLSASIFTVGCRSMNELTAPAVNIINATARITAATIITI